MPIEYEATFPNIDINAVRKKLENTGATLMRPMFLQKRVAFHLPKGHEIEEGWVRVRDEGDKITMSLKAVNGKNISDQFEIGITVNNFEPAIELLKKIGCAEKSYQENRREIWHLDNCEVVIDEWPFLDPLVEIEGPDEASVRAVSEKLGFEYTTARFVTAGNLYAEKYGLTEDRINNHTPKIVFEMENPFLS